MKREKRKIFIFFILLGMSFSFSVFAQNTTNFTSCNSELSEGCYTLLEPLGDVEGIQVGGNEEQYQGIGGFINFVFEIGIGIGGVLGVVMLVIYGFQYATNEQSVGKFTEIQKRVTSVMLGLLLLLGTFVLLRTINPDLLLVDPRISGVGFELDVGKLSLDQSVSGGGQSTTPLDISNIYNKNNTEYDSVLKSASNNVGLDCSVLKAFMYVESSAGTAKNNQGLILSPVGARGIIQIMPTTAYDTLPDATRRKIQSEFNETINYKWPADKQNQLHIALKKQGINLDDPQINANIGANLIKGFLNNPGNTQGKGIVRYAAHAYNGGRGANEKSSQCNNRVKWLCSNTSNPENRTYGPKVVAAYKKIINNQWSCDINSTNKGFTQLDIE